MVLVCEDAITFQLPPKPLVIYMFHPFNQEVLKEVLQNVFRALRESFRHIIIIYQHPLGPHPHHELTPVLKNATFLRPAMVGVATRGWNIYETVTANEFTLLADSLGASA